MGRKDIITKEYMEDTEVFADVFNHMIYKGEKVIDPKNLKELDTANVIIPYGANGAERGRRKILKRRNQIPQSFFQAFTEKTGCFQL